MPRESVRRLGIAVLPSRRVGADVVERELHRESRCSAVNWSEVARKVIAHGADWELARSLLLSFGLQIEPVEASDVERAARLWKRGSARSIADRAARLWKRGSARSIADRICLASALRLAAHVWTADAAWGNSDQITQVR